MAMSTREGRSAAPLESDRGITTIANTVVAKVAGIAAREVPGVHRLGGGVRRALGRIGVAPQETSGVSVEVGKEQAAVDLSIITIYGESIPEVSRAVRDNVAQRVEAITGLKVTEVNIDVNDLYFPGEEEEPQPRVQ
jgi:uncharacterized alkaline shock family protein YloU